MLEFDRDISVSRELEARKEFLRAPSCGTRDLLPTPLRDNSRSVKINIDNQLDILHSVSERFRAIASAR